MYSLAHSHVNALCFLSQCLCQTRGPLFSRPGLERHSVQAPTWCASALAQFTRSLAPQTRLLASSRFSPSVLASQQPKRIQSAGMRWENSIQKHLMADGWHVTDWMELLIYVCTCICILDTIMTMHNSILMCVYVQVCKHVSDQHFFYVLKSNQQLSPNGTSNSSFFLF